MRLRLLAAAAIVPATVLATAVPAHASAPDYGRSVKKIGNTGTIRAVSSTGLHCTGTPAYRKIGHVAGKAVVELDVYVRSINGGTVYACVKHVGATAGVRSATGVAVVGLPTPTSKARLTVTITGSARSLLGPAAIGGTLHHYVAAAAYVTYKGKKVSVAMPVYEVIRKVA